MILDPELPALQLDQVAHLDGDALLTLERAVEDLEELVEALPVADEVDHAERSVLTLHQDDEPVHQPLERRGGVPDSSVSSNVIVARTSTP